MPQPEILDLPPEEAVQHFRAKGFHVGFDWRDTDASTHVRSFTVAKAMKLDILEDIQGAMDEAIADGKTFDWFRDNLEPTLRKKGWWGRQRRVDPVTGESRIVQLGSPRRLRIIFDTNLRMAHAHGRWQGIERLKERMPYLRYVSVRDARTRPEHARWHGTVLPVDHPFWRTHYPPNGWRCRCLVQQLSEDDLERYGSKVSSGPPPGSEQTRPWVNRRTGEAARVAVGIDPGFTHNVGRIDPGKAAADRLVAKIDAAPEALARVAIGTPWQTPLFARHLAGATQADWPVAILPEAVLSAIGARSRTVRLSGETAAKQTVRHPDLAPADYARIQRIFEEGEVFVSDDRRIYAFVQEDDRLWRAVIKATRDGSETYLASLHRAQPHNLDAARRRTARIE